jgi:hypothetical protein
MIQWGTSSQDLQNPCSTVIHDMKKKKIEIQSYKINSFNT